MLSRFLANIGVTALLYLTPFWVAAEVAIPPLQQRVTDLTQTLSPSEQQALEQRLKGLEQRSGAQVAILLVSTTQPEDVFSFGMRVVENWKLGKKGKDDGVLILLAKNDRKNQILVGYGLEGQLPDVVAKRILDDEARPYFKNGDFNGGLNVIVSAVAYRIEGKVMEASSVVGQQAPVDSYQTPNQPRTLTIQDRAFSIAVVIFLFGQVLRFMMGPMKAASASAALGLGIVTFSLGSLTTGLVCAVALFLIVLFFRFSWLWLLLLSSGSGGSSRGGGGGGGFSGGGGSFGGGGSSGSW